MFHNGGQAVDLLAFNEMFFPDIKRALHALYIKCLSPSDGARLAKDAAVATLCDTILWASPSRRRKPHPKDRPLTRRELCRALEVLEHEVASGNGLEYVAAQVGLSTFHFARAFKLATGESPHQYLIERRLARAKEALIYTERSLTDIAISCGFSSQSHMTTAFRRHVSVTPLRFRNFLKDH